MTSLSNEDRNNMIDIYFEKAVTSLSSAILLFELNDYNGAANRAYYSVFQAASALLLTKNIERYSHKHVHRAIFEEFAESGKIPRDFDITIKKIEAMRTTGDYSKIKSVTKEEIGESISEAKAFLNNTKKLIVDFKLEQNINSLKENKAEKTAAHENEI